MVPSRGGGGFTGMDFHLPRVTKWFIIAYVGLSIANALSALWFRLGSFGDWLVFSPSQVLEGHVWRLVTYPFIGAGLDVLLNALMIFFFARPLEYAWGQRRYVTRILWLVVTPAAGTVLLSLVVPRLGDAAVLVGPRAFITAAIVAYACSMGSARMYMFPLPIPLSGDAILWFEGVVLLFLVLFSGSVLQWVPFLLSFAFALAWFRFDLARDLRRQWLLFKQRRVQGKLSRMQRERKLRVIRSDDDQPDDRRYLH